jgi:TetR/AcrR family transcriptional regulator, transcriptional repressor for nem operon
MSTTTKARILDAAESIMLEKSFHSVGLNEILQAVKVPKGSFYHYFSSKEQFGVELLQHYCDEATAYKKRILLSPTPQPDPAQRLFTYFEGSILKTTENEGRCPCLVIKLAAEVSDLSDAMRQVLATATATWIGILSDLIKEGIASKSFRKDLIPAQTGALIHDLWNGAMQRASTCRCVTPLNETLAFLRSLLLPKS